LDNYIKRGFSVYKVDEQPMPERYLWVSIYWNPTLQNFIVQMF
jgi:hypothetical protein